jgi:AcrR family transcriptional regulator
MVQKPKSKTASADQSLKETLIVAGEKILEMEGLAALTLRATARAAGVSHMAPYRHFDDKAALLAAIAERGFRGLGSAMRDAVNPGGGENPSPRASGVAYVVFAGTHPALYRLMFSAGIQDKSRYPDLAEASRAAFLMCSDAAGAGDRSGEKLSAEAQMRRSIATWALVHGLASLVIDGKIPVAEDDPVARARTIEAILTSL